MEVTIYLRLNRKNNLARFILYFLRVRFKSEPYFLFLYYSDIQIVLIKNLILHQMLLLSPLGMLNNQDLELMHHISQQKPLDQNRYNL